MEFKQEATVGHQAEHLRRVGSAPIDGDAFGQFVQANRVFNKRRATGTSRFAVSAKSTVWPSSSMAWYRDVHGLAIMS